MLDHVIVTVSNFTRSIAFYEQALKPLGTEKRAEGCGHGHRSTRAMYLR
jgi:hypothetical protein